MELELTIEHHATCPLCHAAERSLSNDALAAGGEWSCATCGHRWDARRLATVAAYADWVRERERAGAAA